LVNKLERTKKVCGHQKLQGNFRLHLKFRDFYRAVGIAEVVVEILDDLLQDRSRNLTEVDFSQLLFSEGTCYKYIC